MNDKKWATFFELLEEIVDAPGKLVAEKVAAVKEAAKRDGGAAEMNLEEFMAWDFGY